MIKADHFYMRTTSKSMCVLVHQVTKIGTAMAQWYSLDAQGNATAISDDLQELYMHPDVWQDITAMVTPQEESWLN